MNITITREGVLGTILGAALVLIYQYPAPGTVLYLEIDGDITQRAIFNNQVDCRIIKQQMDKVGNLLGLTWHCKGQLWTAPK